MATETTSKEAPTFQAPKKKKKWVKRLVALALVVGLLALLLTRCMQNGGQTASGAYLPAAATIQDLVVAVTGPGTIKPNDSYRATALVRGEILSAPFEEGQEIHKDDVLFVVDSSDVETSIQQAQLAVQSAQLSYDSLVRSRNDNAKDRQIKANAAGVVEHLYVDQGDNVVAGTPVADILDRDNMKLTVPFHASDAAGFYVGQSASVAVSGTAETLSGSITEISATDTVGLGGTLVRNVTVTVSNPGALSNLSVGSAVVGSAASAATANFQYAASKQVVAKASGELLSLSVKEGDRVYDGQLLGEVKEVNLQDQIDAAAIQLQNAQLSLQRAQDSLEDYTITSPIDGTVIEKNYKEGDNYDPSTATSTGGNAFMTVIYDMSRLTFDINVAETDVVKLKAGQPVRFTADALDGQEFTGVVEKVNINGTTAGGNTSYPVTVAVDGNGMDLAQQGLLPGMSVSASIIVEEIQNVLAVPVDAIQRGNTVLVAGPDALDKDGNLMDAAKLEEREVTLGRNNDEYIEILSGLEEGELVFIQYSASSFMSNFYM